MIRTSIWRLLPRQGGERYFKVLTSKSNVVDYHILMEIRFLDFEQRIEDFELISQIGNEYICNLTEEQFALILLEADDIRTGDGTL